MIKICRDLSSLQISFFCLFVFWPWTAAMNNRRCIWRVREWESSVDCNDWKAYPVRKLCFCCHWSMLGPLYLRSHFANKTTETVNIKPIVLLTMLVDTYKSISVQILVNRNNYYLQFLCTYNIHLKRYCSIFLCFTVAFYFPSFASCCFAFIFSDGVSVLVVCLTHNVPRKSKHLC